MKFTTLISVQQLASLMKTPDVLILDCRFDLGNISRGELAYRVGHIPGAHYANLNTDLADQSKSGLGRHPLPDASAFAATLARWGYLPEQQVVVYDDAGGAIAARAWWMLRLAGHTAIAVLDGGIQAWQSGGLELEENVPESRATKPDVSFDVANIVYFAELSAKMQSADALLLDARAAPRFRGDVEPIDPVAGHVPGAINRPFAENLLADGRFKSPALLQEEFNTLLVGRNPSALFHSCGSGVTACHNLLAMEHAGLAGSRVFAPSWSGWISDQTRPVARG